MRLASFVVYAALVSLACGGGAPADRAAARDTSRAPAAALDTTIHDTLTIYEAHSLPGEPYWAVEILNEGIRYHWAGNRAGVVFGAGRVEGGDSLSMWTSKRVATDGPRSLQLELLRVPCSDRPPSPYRAALVVDGQSFQGCARRGTLAAQRGEAP